MRKSELSRLDNIAVKERASQKALPHGESPEPAPVKYIENPPPGWTKRTLVLGDGTTSIQWHRNAVQRSSLKEAWEMAIQDSHETLSAVAGRFTIAGDDEPETT